MTRALYTPGPWRLDDTRIVSDAVRDEWNDQPQGVVDLYGAMGGDDTNADAHLIAAAPELFEALVELTALMQAVYEGEYTPDSFTTQPALRAIAKAQGDGQ